MKKFYKLNDKELLKFKNFKTDVIDVIVNDVENLFKNNKLITSDNYTFICGSESVDGYFSIFLELDTGIKKYKKTEALKDLILENNPSEKYVKYFKKLIGNFKRDFIFIDVSEKDFLNSGYSLEDYKDEVWEQFTDLWDFLPIHSNSIIGYKNKIMVGKDKYFLIKYSKKILKVYPFYNNDNTILDLSSEIDDIIEILMNIDFNKKEVLGICYNEVEVYRHPDRRIEIYDKSGDLCDSLFRKYINNDYLWGYKNFEIHSRHMFLKYTDGKIVNFVLKDLDKEVEYKNESVIKFTLTDNMLNTILDYEFLDFYKLLSKNIDNPLISMDDVKDYKTLCFNNKIEEIDLSLAYLIKLSKRVYHTYDVNGIKISPYRIVYHENSLIEDLTLKWITLISENIDIVSDIDIKVKCSEGFLQFREGCLIVNYYNPDNLNKNFYKKLNNCKFKMFVQTKTFFYMVC